MAHSEFSWQLFLPVIFLLVVADVSKSAPDVLLGDEIQAAAGKAECPRREDIHPCECIEIPRPQEEKYSVETVAFCKTIRNTQVLQNAMKGMRGHIIDFMVLDSCKLPPFPNGLFFNIQIKWMEIINSTIQIKENFFNCANDCW